MSEVSEHEMSAAGARMQELALKGAANVPSIYRDRLEKVIHTMTHDELKEFTRYLAAVSDVHAELITKSSKRIDDLEFETKLLRPIQPGSVSILSLRNIQ